MVSSRSPTAAAAAAAVSPAARVRPSPHTSESGSDAGRDSSHSEEDDDDRAHEEGLRGPVAEFRRTAPPSARASLSLQGAADLTRSGSLTAAMAKRLSDSVIQLMSQEPGTWAEEADGEDAVRDADMDEADEEEEEEEAGQEGEVNEAANGLGKRATTPRTGGVDVAETNGKSKSRAGTSPVPARNGAAAKKSLKSGESAVAAQQDRRKRASKAGDVRSKSSSGAASTLTSDGADSDEEDGDSAASQPLPVASSPPLPIRRKHAHPDVQGLLRLSSTVRTREKGGEGETPLLLSA